MLTRNQILMAVLACSAFLVAGCSNLQAGWDGLTGGGDTEVADESEVEDETTTTETTDADAKYKLAPYTGVKHAIGVKDFTNDAGYGRYDLNRNLSLMLESALYDTDRFVMVEREKLDIIQDEQALVSSGATAQQNQVAQSGKLRPAKYIATGAITQVDYDESGQNTRVRVPGVPARVGLSGGKAQITCIVKLVDTTTGEVAAKKSIVGKAGRTGFNVSTWRGPVSGSFGAFQKTPLAEAAQDAINQAAYFIALEMEDEPITGAVVTNTNGFVIINRGERHNYQTGMTLKVTEEGEQLIDPTSGMILGMAEGAELGTLEITRVADNLSYCKVIDGPESFETGSVVTLIE